MTRFAAKRRIGLRAEGRSFVSWHLKGSYVETCSCELMCPCNLSFDHGSRIDAFGIAYEGKTGMSTSEFAWAA